MGDHGGCVRLVSGQPACWRSNLFGQLGMGTSDSETTAPSLVTGIDDATTLARGDNWACVARKSSPNSVWCWGTNESGEVTGDGTTSGQVGDAGDPTPFQPLPVEVKLPE